MPYKENGITYRFNTEAFRRTLEIIESKRTQEIRRMASAMHISVASIKEWRRGSHEPSDIEKVRDLARYFNLNDNAFLKAESEDNQVVKTTLTDFQLAACSRIYCEIQSFFELIDLTDNLIWKEYSMLELPRSLTADIRPSWLCERSRKELNEMRFDRDGILAYDLFEQLDNRIWRALRRERLALAGTGAYKLFEDYITTHIDEYPYNEDGEWMLDPDLIFEPPYDTVTSPITTKLRIAGEAMDNLVATLSGCA